MQIGGSRHRKQNARKKTKGKRKRKGGSVLAELGVPVGLLAATQYMKRRKHKKSSKKSTRKSKSKSRRRRR